MIHCFIAVFTFKLHSAKLTYPCLSVAFPAGFLSLFSKRYQNGAEKLLLKLLIDLLSAPHSEPAALARGSEVKGGYLPRNAEDGGGGVEGPTHREESRKRRKGKTEEETNRVTQYFIQEKIE